MQNDNISILMLVSWDQNNPTVLKGLIFLNSEARIFVRIHVKRVKLNYKTHYYVTKRS